jgi:hypothetical protein
MNSGKLLWISAIILYVSLHAFSQNNPNTDQGMKPYDSFHGGALDSVSMTSGNLFFHKTEYALPQRGRVAHTFSLQYNNKGFQLQIVCVNGSKGPWQSPPGGTNPSSGGTGCTANYLWHWVGSGVALSSDQILTVTSQYVDSGQQNGYGQEVYVYLYNANTSDGSKHQLADTGNGYRSIDASGIFTTNSGAVDRTGMYNGGALDGNGNYLSGAVNPATWTDTLGRVIPQVPAPPNTSTASLSSCPNLNLPYQPVTYAYTWTVPSPAGPSQYLLCYASVYIRTALFGGTYQSSTYLHDVSQSVNMLQSVVRPDGSVWTFAYDGANPNDTTSIGYGDLLKIGFPMGGSISYTYATTFPYQGQYSSGVGTDRSRSVVTRTVDANDGNGPHSWTYSWANVITNTTSNYVVENTVTDPLGNDTVHQITGFFGGPSLFETQTRSYQGSKNSGTLLKTVNTDYSYSSNPFDQVGPTPSGPTAINVVPIRVTTILSNGLTTKEEKDYDNGFIFRDPLWGAPVYPPMPETSATYPGTLGTVSARREYDFGSGSPGNLLRQTFTTYLWQGNSNYLSANLRWIGQDGGSG